MIGCSKFLLSLIIKLRVYEQTFTFFFYPGIFFFTTTLLAQNDHFAYVVTDINKEGANWSFLRKVDLRSGVYSDVLMSGNDAKQLAYDAASKKQLTEAYKDESFGIIASAVGTPSLYAVDIKTLKASAVQSDLVWRSSDLGNSNLLATRTVIPLAPLMSAFNETTDGRVQVYPNPVVNKQFALQFNQLEGNYTVQVTDAMGRQQKAQTIVNVKGKGQIEAVELPASTLKGVYLVKVLDHTSKTVFTRKIVVQ